MVTFLVEKSINLLFFNERQSHPLALHLIGRTYFSSDVVGVIEFKVLGESRTTCYSLGDDTTI